MPGLHRSASIGPTAASGPRFPYLTIRDQVAAQAALADALGVDRWAAVIGGSMGGMHALEWAVGPDRVERLAVLAAPPTTTADQVALNSVQLEAIRMDPRFAGGEYYDAADGEGPHRGLALARRMALLNYRSPVELNQRFQRSWQSDVSPLGHGGRFAVESYLDFHGNKFTRRFDANSYLTLVEAMNSHDVGRDRGGVEDALARVTARRSCSASTATACSPSMGSTASPAASGRRSTRRPSCSERLRPRRLPHRDGCRRHPPAPASRELSTRLAGRAPPSSAPTKERARAQLSAARAPLPGSSPSR
jgi:homoserine O-acetyltransferase